MCHYTHWDDVSTSTLPSSVAGSLLMFCQRESASPGPTTLFLRGGTRSLSSYSIERASFLFR